MRRTERSKRNPTVPHVFHGDAWAFASLEFALSVKETIINRPELRTTLNQVCHYILVGMLESSPALILVWCSHMDQDTLAKVYLLIERAGGCHEEITKGERDWLIHEAKLRLVKLSSRGHVSKEYIY